MINNTKRKIILECIQVNIFYNSTQRRHTTSPVTKQFQTQEIFTFAQNILQPQVFVAVDGGLADRSQRPYVGCGY